MILGLAVFVQLRFVTYGQTDGQTDDGSYNTVLGCYSISFQHFQESGSEVDENVLCDISDCRF